MNKETVSIVSPVVAGLASIATAKIASAMKAGIGASVAIGALIVADIELNGTALGRKALLKSVKQRMVNRGELKASSFDTMLRIGSKLASDYQVECAMAIKALDEEGRNTPLTANEVFDAVLTALKQVPGLLSSYTALRAATIGGVPMTKEEKARSAARNLTNAVNKLTDVAMLDNLGLLALLRSKALNTTGGADVASVMAEANALAATILAAFAEPDMGDALGDDAGDDLEQAA